jgi:hypothetical protein
MPISYRAELSVFPEIEEMHLRSMKLAALACVACLSLAAGSGVASAQSLPMINPDDPLQQVVLAGEASAVAQYLGISIDQLRSELDGHSLAQVAVQHGKSVSEVTAVVVDAADQQLDAAVSQGQVSSRTATQYKAQLAFFAPFLVSSSEASAMALQAAS